MPGIFDIDPLRDVRLGYTHIAPLIEAGGPFLPVRDLDGPRIGGPRNRWQIFGEGAVNALPVITPPEEIQREMTREQLARQLWEAIEVVTPAQFLFEQINIDLYATPPEC